jgi:bifunctional DNase/RNase
VKEYSIDSRTSDAVALALRFNCPIYITEDILEKAGIIINPSEPANNLVSDDDSMFLTEAGKYDSYSDEELYRMIDEAIKTEDYERAASIRDEIGKRKKK